MQASISIVALVFTAHFRICQATSDTPSVGRSLLELGQIQARQRQLLAFLGLDARPNVSLAFSEVPTVLLDRYKRLQGRQRGKLTANKGQNEELADDTAPETYLLFGTDTPCPLAQQEGQQQQICITFDVSNAEYLRQAIGLTLLSVKVNSDIITNQQQTVVVTGDSGDDVTREHSVTVDGTTISLNLTEFVLGWHPMNGSRMLKLHCRSCSSNEVFVTSGARNRPVLEIRQGVSSNGARSRRRRHSGVCNGVPSGNCCLQRFYVNFTEIGWSDWIIQPAGYYANYCMGTCRIAVHSVHDKILTDVVNTRHVQRDRSSNSRSKTKDDEIYPCCRPQRLAPLPLIYALGEDDIRTKTVAGMSVTACGC